MSGHGTPPGDAARWRRIEAVLDEALDLPREAVAAYLDEACAGDAALRAEVEALLDADARAGGFLSRGPLEAITRVAGAGATDPGAPALSHVGPYRLTRELGRGGMGIVYLAERDDGQFEQTVAIKLVRGGLDTEDVRRRFEAERQILARLQHPNIARLVDGGLTADGQPWFAMEHVDGVPLTRYCRERSLALREVLRLFVQVCSAVRYAHRNLIVHRDLKPGNVLVTGHGEVKLLDFGIARLIDPLTGAGEATVAAPRMLTPVYAAPEQVRGEPVTTATDVYSLGVVLYELLTGVRPYRGRLDRIEDAQRAILTEEPRTPSTATRGESPTAAGSPATPGSSDTGVAGGAAAPDHAPDVRQAGWRDRLRGDLDHIVLMALRKEPERRYASAEALLDDLERYLEGHPVRATPPTPGYRLRKYVERHRVGVTAGALVALALVAGLAATSWQARVAAGERDRARAEARKAEEIKDFTLGLFHAADPEEGRADQMTVRELLDQGTARVEAELAGQPAVQADLYDLLGHVYAELEVNDRAESLMTRSLDLRRATVGVHDTAYATSLMNLAIQRSYFADFERALALGREALEIRRRASPGTAGKALNDFAVALERAGHRAPAESLYRESLTLDEARYGPDHPEIASTLSNYGQLLAHSDREAEAEPLLRRAVDIHVRRMGPEHLVVANEREALGLCLADMGRLAAADSQMSQVLAIRRQRLAPDHPDIGRFLANYATLKNRMGDYAAAETLFLRGLEIRRKAYGDDHFDVVSTMNNLAIVYYRIGDFANAATWFARAHTGMVRTLGADHPGTLTCLTNTGVVLRETGRLAEADSALTRGLAGRLKTLDMSHPTVSQSLHHLGILRHRQGRLEDAERLLRQALAVKRKAYDDGHFRVGETASALADVLRDRGRAPEALTLYDEASRIARDTFEGAHPQTADALEGKGRLLLATGRAAAAEPLLAEALAIRREKQPRFAAGIARLEEQLARCRGRLAARQ